MTSEETANKIDERRQSRLERRRTTRHSFGAVAEVTDVGSKKYVVALTRDLNAFGCFITTTRPFSEGTTLRLRITSSGAQFNAIGKVTGNVTSLGMGIEFVEIAPEDRAVIEKLLSYSVL
jgi:hypothetical protein